MTVIDPLLPFVPHEAMSVAQRLLPVMHASRNSGFSHIAVTLSAIAAHLQRLARHRQTDRASALRGLVIL